MKEGEEEIFYIDEFGRSNDSQGFDSHGDSISDIESKRRRSSHPETWKRNLRKSRRNLGLEYISTRNIVVPARKMKARCPEDKCKFKCKRINDEQRQTVFKKFWSLGDVDKQWSFVARCMDPTQGRYRRVQKGNNRSSNHAFFFEIKDARVRVCKTFFMATLSIGNKLIQNVQKRIVDGFIPVDQRGRHCKLKETANHMNLESTPNFHGETVRKHGARANMLREKELYENNSVQPDEINEYKTTTTSRMHIKKETTSTKCKLKYAETLKKNENVDNIAPELNIQQITFEEATRAKADVEIITKYVSDRADNKTESGIDENVFSIQNTDTDRISDVYLDEQTVSKDSENADIDKLNPENSVSQNTSEQRKKRKCEPASWKKNLRKKLRNLGMEYVNSKNIVVPARQIKSRCEGEKCLFQCKKIDEEQRRTLFKEFWELGNLVDQWSYVARCMVPLQGRYRLSHEGRCRALNNAFYFEVDGFKIRVCKKFFMATLDIGSKLIENVQKRIIAGFIPEDQRGKHDKKPRPKLKNDQYEKTITASSNGSKNFCDVYQDYVSLCEGICKDDQISVPNASSSNDEDDDGEEIDDNEQEAEENSRNENYVDSKDHIIENDNTPFETSIIGYENEKEASQGYTYNNKLIDSSHTLKFRCSEDYCKFECREINDQQRRSILLNYRELESDKEQKEYLLKCMIHSEEQILSRYGGRVPNAAFYLEVDGQKYQVCKQFFISTLDIGDKIIRQITKNSSILDHQQVNAKPDKVESLEISTYRAKTDRLRKQTSREFISAEKTLTEIYLDYVNLCKEEGKKFSNYATYRKVFMSENNISFFTPQKIQCLTCDSFKNSIEKDADLIKYCYEQHIHENERSKEEKAIDKSLAKNGKCTTVCFDLQIALPTPCGNAAQFYYKRQLSTFNFTIFDVGQDIGHCYVWHEGLANCGPNEIGSCLYKYLAGNAHGNPIIFYSDDYTGQNKNGYIVSLFMYMVENYNIPSITQKFVSVGHTPSEIEQMHSAIEKQKKIILKSGPITVPAQWVTIIQTAAKKGNPFIVNEMGTDDMYDLKKLCGQLCQNFTITDDDKKIAWTDIKMIEVVKGETSFKVKTSYDEAFQNISIVPKKPRGYFTGMPELSKAYAKEPGIPNAKKSDLLSLCTENIIKQQYHHFYESLTVANKPKQLKNELSE